MQKQKILQIAGIILLAAAAIGLLIYWRGFSPANAAANRVREKTEAETSDAGSSRATGTAESYFEDLAFPENLTLPEEKAEKYALTKAYQNRLAEISEQYGDTLYARVGKAEITRAQFEQAKYTAAWEEEQTRATAPADVLATLDPPKTEAEILNELVYEAICYAEAERLDLVPTEAEMAQLLYENYDQILRLAESGDADAQLALYMQKESCEQAGISLSESLMLQVPRWQKSSAIARYKEDYISSLPLEQQIDGNARFDAHISRLAEEKYKPVLY